MPSPEQTFENLDQAQGYVQAVRQHYRDGHGEYRGRRTEEQQLIAEVTSDEARAIVDGVMLGVFAVAGSSQELPSDYEDTVETAGYSWKDFRGEFERLLAGFGVLTSRLQRDGYHVPSYADLGEADRMKAASVLFSDFIRHNALRFGVDPTGLKRSIREHDGEGGMQVIVRDKDQAKNAQEVDRNMKVRGYVSEAATHIAGKMSPSEYIAMRREFPELDKDQFDYTAAFYTNAHENLRERNQ